MKLESPAFENGQEMDQKYGSKGRNVSVPLAWSDAPQDAQSFALVMVDRHPVAKEYIHWMVSNIPADVARLEEGASSSMPSGAEELVPYAGPFPPSGTHDYEFILYALDTPTLGLAAGVDFNTFTKTATQHALAAATMTGRFTNMETGNLEKAM